MCHEIIDDYVKDGENERYFIFPNNNTEIATKEKIPLLPFHFLMGDINTENDSKLGLEHV